MRITIDTEPQLASELHKLLQDYYLREEKKAARKGDKRRARQMFMASLNTKLNRGE